MAIRETDPLIASFQDKLPDALLLAEKRHKQLQDYRMAQTNAPLRGVNLPHVSIGETIFKKANTGHPKYRRKIGEAAAAQCCSYFQSNVSDMEFFPTDFTEDDVLGWYAEDVVSALTDLDNSLEGLEEIMLANQDYIELARARRAETTSQVTV